MQNPSIRRIKPRQYKNNAHLCSDRETHEITSDAVHLYGQLVNQVLNQGPYVCIHRRGNYHSRQIITTILINQGNFRNNCLLIYFLRICNFLDFGLSIFFVIYEHSGIWPAGYFPNSPGAIFLFDKKRQNPYETCYFYQK